MMARGSQITFPPDPTMGIQYVSDMTSTSQSLFDARPSKHLRQAGGRHKLQQLSSNPAVFMAKGLF